MADLELEREFDIVHGRPDAVSGLLRRVVCRNPGPYTFKGTASYIVGHGDVAIVDPGPDDDEHLGALLDAVRGETVSHIVVTHAHHDHSSLAPRLQKATQAPVYAYGRPASGPMQNDAEALEAGFDVGFRPDHHLGHGDVVAGRGWTLEALHTPGHTSDHLALALHEDNALLSGDHVMAWSTSVVAPPDGSMADYFASLRLLLDRDEQVYWPGHGPPTRSPKTFVRALLGHRQMREAAIFERLRQGDRTVMEVVRAIYADVDPRLHQAAALSALAHIEHLMAQGKVAADGPPSLTATYRVA